MDATLLSHRLNRVAVLLGHFGQEWNHANSSAYKMLPVNQAKDSALLSYQWGQLPPYR